MRNNNDNIKNTKKIKQQSTLVYLILFIFLIHGILYSGVLPLWEGFDEPVHFAYIQQLAENKQIPVTGKSFASQEVVLSIISLPISQNLNYAMKLEDWLSYSKYWSTNLSTSNNAYNIIVSLPYSARSSPSISPSLLNWEAQQAPLYYILSTSIYFLFYNSDLFVRVYVLRLFSIILVAIAIFIIFKTASILFDDFFMRFGTLILVALNPMFVVTVARVGNHSLDILLFSLFFYFSVKFLKNELDPKLSIQLGLILGLGLLTRASFFIALIITLLLLIFKYWQKEYRLITIFKHSIFIFGIAFIISGWWYIQNLVLYNNLSGMGGMPSGSFSDLYNAFLSTNWVFYFSSVFFNYWALFGWSFIRLPPEFYIFLFLLSLISISSILIMTYSNRKTISPLLRNWQVQSLLIFAISIILMAASLAYLNLKYYWVFSMSIFTNGYYLYEISTSNAILLLLGLRTITPIRYRSQFPFALFIIMIIYNLIIIFNVLIPSYYW